MGSWGVSDGAKFKGRSGVALSRMFIRFLGANTSNLSRSSIVIMTDTRISGYGTVTGLRVWCTKGEGEKASNFRVTVGCAFGVHVYGCYGMLWVRSFVYYNLNPGL